MANLPGTKTFETIYTEVSNNAFGRLATSEDVPVSLTRLKQIVNDSQREICTKKDWSWLYTEADFTLTGGQTTAFALPDACGAVLGLSIPSENVKLGEISMEAWTLLYPDRFISQTTGQPEVYIKGANATNNAMQIFVWPSPAATYTARLFYRKRVSDMTNTTDVPVIPVDWQDVLIAHATAECFRALNDDKSDKAAQRWQARYLDRFQDMFIQDCNNKEYAPTITEPNATVTGRSDAALWRSAQGY